MDKISLLQQTFPGLDKPFISEILLNMRETTYPANTTLCTEGAIEQTFYIILNGQVAITKWIAGVNEERLLRFSENGDFFGEMALIHGNERLATVRTTQETTLLEMQRQDFLNLLQKSPPVALVIVRTTIDRLRSNDKKQITELQKTYEELQQLDNAKLDFIEVAAHELRTPLTVIQGYGKVIEMSTQGDENLQQVSQGLQDGVTRMLNVVNAMLDVSKINSQTLQVSPAPVLPKLVTSEALHTFGKALEKRQITILEDHTSSETLPYINADPELLNKLFYQLISNAIKYTPDGGYIKITSHETHDSRIGHGTHITVEDTGVGIPANAVQKIFERFYQGGDVSLHSSSKTAFMGGGPGLGLAIAKGIVEAHNGAIWVESHGYNPEKFPGAAFHVLLPANL